MAFRRLLKKIFASSSFCVLIFSVLSSLTFALENNPANQKWACSTDPTSHQWTCKITPTKATLSQALGWVPDTTDTILASSHPSDCSTCGGHYYLPPIDNPEDASKPIDGVPSNISADQANYQISGEGTLTGNVKVIQPGRILTADTATIYQQETTPGSKKVNRITAQGNLSIRQPDTLVLAENLDAELFSHKTEVKNAHYLWHLKPGFSGTLEGDENFTGFAHGSAETAYQRSQNIYDFYHASYATCPPDQKTWVLHADHIQLNHESDRGYATNVWLTAHDIPVFYTPYFSFPLDKDRQTGFLYGSVGYSAGSGNGASITAPYYFNIAPNYDDTLTPSLYQQRGLLLSNEARFLTEHSSGELDLQYIADQYTHENRGSVKFTQNTQLSPNWNLNGQYNYLSDQDFLSDFSNAYALASVQTGTPGAGLATQNNVAVLPRAINLDYSDSHWNWQNNLTQYQIVDQTFLLENRPYNLLPQSTLMGSFPKTKTSLSPFDFNLFGQFTNFQKSPSNNEEAINAQRLLINPSLDLPLTTSYGFLTPGVVLNASTYELQNINGNAQFPNNHVANVIPQLNVRSGLYFDRNFSFFGHGYAQTIEPQVMYLFTPNINQNNIPSFDTAPLSFDYSQLFALNRFSGYDRIGDTNQVSYGLETTVRNEQGAQIFEAGIGQIYYLMDRHTTLCWPSASCIVNENPNYLNDTSPIAAQTSIALNNAWNLNASAAYDTRTQDMSYQNYGIQYIPDPQHVFNLNYVVNQNDYSLLTRDQILSGISPPKSQQITTSAIWKFTPVWHLLGDWDYSLIHQKTVSEFAAIEYNQCCFAIQVGIYRYLLTDNPNDPNDLSGTLETSFVGQILLKGLGGIGENNFEQLAQQIPGYSPASQI
jgi:LPS-assembly protein